jgi:hypothetical protein
MLRHALKTLSYRLEKVLRDAPAAYGSFRPVEGARTPEEILAHMGDLMDWALGLADGHHVWREAAPGTLASEQARFAAALQALDARIAAAPLLCEENRLFQGPIADALSHTGQLALLRRMHGSPVPPKNYFKAEI